jgi:pimeloyl-ACP methyl ester carboxylesterase
MFGMNASMEKIGGIRIRRHGTEGPVVIVIHGGPGAPGSAEALATGLSDIFRVVEPWQRGSGGHEPLTVAGHVADLHEVLLNVCDDQFPALVGESWGAMLALAYAAEHPQESGPIVLVGCGTFDKKSRDLEIKIREDRIAQHIAKHPEFADDLNLDPKERIMKWHEMTDTYRSNRSSLQTDDIVFDKKGHVDTWNDMLRCQESGLYPAAFSRIVSPVLMLHGAYDPHPGKMIRDSLTAHIPHLEYREFERCGHQPSIEMFARDEFFSVMTHWLALKCLQEDYSIRS